jgi:integrase
LLAAHGRTRISHRFDKRGPSRLASPIISDITTSLRSGVLFESMRELHVRFGLDDVAQLRERHVKALVQIWMTRRYSGSTLQTRMSVLRWWATAIGKHGMVRELANYVDDPAQIPVRTYTCAADQRWEAKGVDPDVIQARVARMCPTAEAMFRLQRYFGLRTNEALQWRPLVRALDFGITVDEGTKGGRIRTVPFSSDPDVAGKQRETVAFCKQIVLARQVGQRNPSITEPIGYPGLSLSASRRAYYRTMNACGIHRSLGVRLHDLRHERAQEEFSLHAGVEAPVRGGVPVDKDEALVARHLVSQMLGHSRPQITNAYIGSDRHISKRQRAIARSRKSLDALLPLLLDRLNKEGAGGKVFLCGPRNTGQTEEGCWEIGLSQPLSPAAHLELQQALREALGAPVYLCEPTEEATLIIDTADDSAVRRVLATAAKGTH